MTKERRRCIGHWLCSTVLPFGGCGTTEQAVIVPDYTLDASQTHNRFSATIPPSLRGRSGLHC